MVIARLRRLLPGALVLLLAGCLGGYAYPTLGYVPSLPAAAPTTEVHAYRVDVTRHDACIEFACNDEYVLRELKPGPGERYWPQLKPGLDYGWFQNYIALIYSRHTHHTVMVRLYRRGYQTIEVPSWERDSEVKWVPVEGWDGREKAIDALVMANTSWPARRADNEQTNGVPATPFADLARGSVAAEHRQALLFAAGEYVQLHKETLSSSLPAPPDSLMEKSRALRRLAAQ